MRAPATQETERPALERLWEAQEKIAALEEMLTKAREREHELTTEAVRHRARIFEAEARIFELSSIAARVTASEEARRDAEAVAQESERAAALAKGEAKVAETEIALLRSRNAELEKDLASIADELAAETVARTEAVRLEREQNEAREREQVEQRLVAEGRLRAAEATLRATRPEDRPADEEIGIPAVTEEDRTPEVPDPVEGEVHEVIPDRDVATGEASVVIVAEASTAEGAEGEAADEGPEGAAPVSSTAEPTGQPAWPTVEPGAPVADPWATWGTTTTPDETDPVSEHADVIDLVGEEADAPASTDKPPFEERVGIDSSARATSGWSETWGLIRGRRKD